MISKTFASAICVGLFALIAFASSATPDRGRIAAITNARTNFELNFELSDGVVVRSYFRSYFRSSVRSGGAQFTASGAACSDSIANCGDPVKHLGTQNECACFACGYGTENQHTVCTQNAADKEALFKRAR
jgi:hypothetical protein